MLESGMTTETQIQGGFALQALIGYSEGWSAVFDSPNFNSNYANHQTARNFPG